MKMSHPIYLGFTQVFQNFMSFKLEFLLQLFFSITPNKLILCKNSHLTVYFAVESAFLSYSFLENLSLSKLMMNLLFLLTMIALFSKASYKKINSFSCSGTSAFCHLAQHTKK